MKLKRNLSLILIAIICIITFTACFEKKEDLPIEQNSETAVLLSTNTISKTFDIENFKFITTYDTGDYDLSRWKITDSKILNITAITQDLPECATVLVENIHINISLKSTNQNLDGSIQYCIDDPYHGTSQDGFFVNDLYPYQKKFAIEGCSKTLRENWNRFWNYTTTLNDTISANSSLTEKNLLEIGKVYANKVQIIYDLLIKYADEEFYHVVSISDEFLIPTNSEIKG